MDIKEFSQRDATYIDYLKRIETELAVTMGSLFADLHACKNSVASEQYCRRINRIGMMLTITRDAINEDRL